jgi:hypothetical protein
MLARATAGGHVDLQTWVTLYLAYLGFAGGLAGVFLWPAVVLHLFLSIFLGRVWLLAKNE